MHGRKGRLHYAAGGKHYHCVVLKTLVGLGILRCGGFFWGFFVLRELKLFDLEKKKIFANEYLAHF